MRNLVVEDEKKVAKVLRDGLEAHHYDVDVAATAEDGFFSWAVASALWHRLLGGSLGGGVREWQITSGGCRPPRDAQQRANVAYAPSSDEDWYTVGFQVPPGSTPQGFVAKFSLKVEDPSLGVLFLDLWQSDLCTPGGPPIRVAGGDILDTQISQSGAGEASVTARVRTDLQYFLHVFGGIQKSLVRVYGGNCYTHVRAEVLDIGGVPAPSPQSANCR